MDLPSRREILAAGSAFAAAPAWIACAGGPLHVTSSPTRDTSGDTLRELLAWNRTKHPRYRGGLANHLSMALWSQHSLGAGEARLREFAASYGAMLESMPTAGPPVDAKEWRQALGRDEALHGFVAHFERELRERGRAAVLHDALDALSPSVGSAAFHCLIRTAFGVRFEDDAEIAHALAYWAVTASTLGTPSANPTDEKDPGAVLQRVRSDERFSKASISGGSIDGRMKQAAAIPGFSDLASSLVLDDAALASIAREMIGLFASTGNFTALHAVTSTHALRIVLPFAADRERLMRFHWQALVAAYIGIGAPAAQALKLEGAPEWPAIGARAVASNDDHDAKLVFACREEAAIHGEGAYRLAAARRVKLAS
ncbi:MAG TPA: questin oxidase family protein [Planctomycetota bacterium]|nr:questin oxidase family protein [Planctomycetota bacterium]